ncbi:hypothetical protein ACGF8B_23610 [Streptomyces sp. NPDC047917]|uniref:hypothetical protein n=1 Tax=Streptomyces sp. NPDC047917 TaxID=3365491 RepID=UPI00371A97F6
MQSTILKRRRKKLGSHLSASVADHYSSSLIDKLSARTGSLNVSERRSGSRSFIALRVEKDCPRFDVAHSHHMVR